MTTNFDHYKLITTCLRLPLTVDSDRVYKEVMNIKRGLFASHARGQTHEQVDAVFLRGSTPQLKEPDQDKSILNELPYISEILSEILPGVVGKCLIADMRAGAVIPMHRDGKPGGKGVSARYFDETIRLHIPITTNDDVSFFCNGRFYKMNPGEIWAINNIGVHGVLNRSPHERRIHLITDIYPDERTQPMLLKSDSPGGFWSENLAAQLMAESMAPPESIYARGKPVPQDPPAPEPLIH